MFHLSAGEIVVLVLLGVIFLGPSKLSELAEGLRATISARVEQRWSRSDRLVVCAAVFSTATALAVFVGPGRLR